MSEELLDNFLSIAASELNDNTVSSNNLKDVSIFSKEDNNKEKHNLGSSKSADSKSSSFVHTGDTDSSDDEDNKYYEERKYNDCGKEMKHLLDSTPSTSKQLQLQSTATWKSKPDSSRVVGNLFNKPQDVYTDPVFGLRIVNPLVSFTGLKEKMTGREAVPFTNIKKFVVGNISDKNWVLAGVIVSKSSVKTSQKGNQFLIWSLSDLKNDIKTVSLFLFGSAYKQLWKTATGTVVGILNSSVLDRKDGSKDEAVLSIDNAQKVMILGQSKDLGTCKSVKKNGEQCTAVVNVNRCEYCIYHIKQEYQKCSKRSELQSSFAGKGLTALRNKVLGKNEVFYAGKSYTAIPAKRNTKMKQRDDGRLQALNGYAELPKAKARQKKSCLKAAANLEISKSQRLRDLSLLEKLGGTNTKTTFNASHSAEVTLESSKKTTTEIIAKLKDSTNNQTSESCSLERTSLNVAKNSVDGNLIKKSAPREVVSASPFLLGPEQGMVNLGVRITTKQVHKAKLNALKYIEKNGTLKKSDPNCIKKSATENRKRVMENIENQENPSKKAKIENEFLSDRFKKIMEANSKHLDLLEKRDNEEQEKYFHKLEMKEKMEEKMINTYKVPCKAVKCLQCKYTNFSASQLCKDNKHPLRVFDAVKRFFKCNNCGNRTQTLEIVPTTSCNNCGSGKWERTGMMKEKKAEVTHKLSIRGGEQTFVNSIVSDANLDLLVPDS